MLDIDSDDDVGFRINEAYAKKYDTWRRGEELQKLKDKYGDRGEESNSSSSETEDEDAEALTAQVEKGWLKTLSALKNKDPKIYQKDVKFYSSEENSSDSEDSEDSSDKVKDTKRDKPVYLKDYERKLMLEKYGQDSSDENESGVAETSREHTSHYQQEQEELRKSIANAVESDDDSDDDEGLLTHRKKTEEEQAEEETDYIEWLKGQKKGLTDTGIEKDLEPLQKYWNDPKLNDGEKFLKDFILYKQYIDKDSDRLPTYDEVVDDGDGISEDELEIERQEMFERKHNFRYEEPGAQTIKTFPRGIDDSVRRKVTKRADTRQLKKERKEQEKEQQKEELMQLKKMKRQEIDQKILRLKEITGNKDIGFSSADLDGDFDPAEHDRMMQQYFAEDYYAEGEEDKPLCPTGDHVLNTENWDQWQGDEDEGTATEHMKDEEEDEVYAEDSKFIMDADYDPTQDTRSSKKKKKKSKLAKALARQKPSFNPDEKTFEEYLDEYYKLDYEDMIGDLPCRFKYRGVVPNNFGLSASEVLTCRDKELNSWVSVKKMSQYRSKEEEKRDISVYRQRASTNKKLNILASLRETDKDAPSTSTAVHTDLPSSSKKKKRKKKGEDKSEGGDEENNTASAADSTSMKKHSQDDESPSSFQTERKPNVNLPESSETVSDSNKKRKRKKRKHVEAARTSVVDTEVSVSKTKKRKNEKNVDSSETGESEVSQSVTEVKKAKTSDTVSQTDHEVSQKSSKKTKKGKRKNFGMSDERLKAYGMNPKKMRYMKTDNFMKPKIKIKK